MDGRIISEGIRLFEKNNDSDLEVFREYINNENNGDVQLNVIRLLDHLQEKAKNNSHPDLNFIKQLQFWIIFRYCGKDNFKLMRGVINHWIDNAKELTLLKNAVNSQSSLTDFLIKNDILKIEDLQSLASDMELDDLMILSEAKKSTKIFKNRIEKLKIENPSIHKQKTETYEEDIKLKKEIEQKPIFKLEAIQTIFDLLKSFFNPERHNEFKQLLETGNDVTESLIFLDNGNRLADAFKQLIKSDIITGCGQIQLENWIFKNFKYIYRGQIKDYTQKYLNDIVSTNKDKCQKPIMNVILDKCTGIIMIRKT